jgi:hypothetical protein
LTIARPPLRGPVALGHLSAQRHRFRSLSDDLDQKEYRPSFAHIQRSGTKMKTATRKWLFSLAFLAEWTGLEPATPGVTGRGMK